MSPVSPTLHRLRGKIASGKSTWSALRPLFVETVGIMVPHVASMLNARGSVALDCQANTVKARKWRHGILIQTSFTCLRFPMKLDARDHAHTTPSSVQYYAYHFAKTSNHFIPSPFTGKLSHMVGQTEASTRSSTTTQRAAFFMPACSRLFLFMRYFREDPESKYTKRAKEQRQIRRKRLFEILQEKITRHSNNQNNDRKYHFDFERHFLLPVSRGSAMRKSSTRSRHHLKNKAQASRQQSEASQATGPSCCPSGPRADPE